MKKNLTLFVAIVGTSLSGAGRAVAQDRPQSAGQNVSRAGSPKSDVPEATSDADIQMLRKDLRSQKKQIVAAKMDFTDAQAEKLRPCSAHSTPTSPKINTPTHPLITESQ